MRKKSLIELEYQEGEDGILYPIVQTSKEEETDQMPLGKYGRMAMKYLRESYQSRYNWLKIEGELMPLMHKVDQESKERLRILEKQLLKKEPIKNPMNTYETYRHRDMIKRTAEEIVLIEIVYKKR